MLASRWRIQLFGGLSVHQGESHITRFATMKTASLLACLALSPRRTHAREELIELFWPDADLEAGQASLRHSLSSLRRQLEPPGAPAGSVLITTRTTVRLNLDTVETDVASFEAALTAARRAATPSDRLSCLNEALDLYAGDLLPGFYDSWAIDARERLELVWEEARVQRHELLRQAQSAAIDLSPPFTGGEEKTAQTSIRHSRSIVSLPPQFTRFFGREDEMAQVAHLVSDPLTRLVTLSGAGGAGKTRLSVEAARRVAHTFDGPVCFVPLAALADPALVPGVILNTLGVTPSAALPPLEQAVAALSAGKTLLVLDNLEQLGEGIAPILLALMTRLPALSILVTSRHRLFLPGERELHLAPLPIPPAAEEALAPEELMAFPGVALFVDRAQTARPDFQITPRNAPTVAALCRRLEGIPLAIELAAAWSMTLTPAQMLGHLTEKLDRLTSRRKDVDDRHQTLWTAIDWSYDLLPPDLSRFWARLSVFRGGWTADAAQEVCAEPQALDALAQLRARSLVLIEDAGEGLRYRLLEPLREFAEEQLTPGTREETARRHAQHFLFLAEQADVLLKGPGLVRCLERLDAESDNIRAALAWHLRECTGADTTSHMASALTRYWELRGRTREGWDWLMASLETQNAMTRTRADALCSAAYLSRRLGNHEEAREQTLSCLAYFREQQDDRGAAKALNNLSGIADESGDYASAKALAQESLALHRLSGDRWSVALCLNNLGLIASHLGEYEDAVALHEESLNLRREIGDPYAVAMSFANLGIVSDDLEKFDLARHYYEQSLALNRTLGFKRNLAIDLNNLANTAYQQGDTDAAETCWQESLTIFEKIGDRQSVTILTYNGAEAARRRGDLEVAGSLYRRALGLALQINNPLHTASALQGLAYIAVADGRHDHAASLFGAIHAYRLEANAAMKAGYLADYNAHVSQAQAALGATPFAAAWNAGAAMTPEQTISYALGETE